MEEEKTKEILEERWKWGNTKKKREEKKAVGCCAHIIVDWDFIEMAFLRANGQTEFSPQKDEEKTLDGFWRVRWEDFTSMGLLDSQTGHVQDRESQNPFRMQRKRRKKPLKGESSSNLAVLCKFVGNFCTFLLLTTESCTKSSEKEKKGRQTPFKAISSPFLANFRCKQSILALRRTKNAISSLFCLWLRCCTQKNAAKSVFCRIELLLGELSSWFSLWALCTPLILLHEPFETCFILLTIFARFFRTVFQLSALKSDFILLKSILTTFTTHEFNDLNRKNTKSIQINELDFVTVQCWLTKRIPNICTRTKDGKMKKKIFFGY